MEKELNNVLSDEELSGVAGGESGDSKGEEIKYHCIHETRGFRNTVYVCDTYFSWYTNDTNPPKCTKCGATGKDLERVW